MDNTLSDYDLIKLQKKERQEEIDQLKSENERLRKALTEIVELYKPTTLSLTAIKMCMVAEQALKEVTNSETDYREHLRNMPESEYRRLHEGRWNNDEREGES